MTPGFLNDSRVINDPEVNNDPEINNDPEVNNGEKTMPERRPCRRGDHAGEEAIPLGWVLGTAHSWVLLPPYTPWVHHPPCYCPVYRSSCSVGVSVRAKEALGSVLEVQTG